jgi:hypothetical protein
MYRILEQYILSDIIQDVLTYMDNRILMRHVIRQIKQMRSNYKIVYEKDDRAWGFGNSYRASFDDIDFEFLRTSVKKKLQLLH